MSQRVTLEDIARESNVSPATVSLALRNKPGVGEDTRRQILQNALDMGYPVPLSKATAEEGVKTMGLIIKVRDGAPPSTNYFYAPVLSGIEGFCREQEMNLLYAHLPVDEDNNPIEPPRLLKEQSTEGLLFVGAFLNQTTMQILLRQDVPVVLVDAYAVDDRYDAVISDNEGGAYEATSYLIARGHQQIAMVGTLPHAYPSILGRRQGYMKAINEHHLSPYFVDCHHDPDEAVPATIQFLQAHPEVTAVFGSNDEVAIGVMRAAQTLGKRVPDDLSIIGFDNISLAQHVTPALTTMRVDKQGMGRLAAQLLFNRIQFPEMGQVQMVIRPSLIERQSVQPLL